MNEDSTGALMTSESFENVEINCEELVSSPDIEIRRPPNSENEDDPWLSGREDMEETSRNALVDIPHTSLPSSVRVVYIVWDATKLKTPVGWLKLLAMVSSVISLICIIGVDFPSLPLSSSLRFFVFSLVFTFLTTSLLFLLEILLIFQLFMVPWEKLNATVHLLLSILMNGSSSTVVHTIIEHQFEVHIHPRTMQTIIVASVSGYLCGMFCMFLGLTSLFCYDHHLRSSWRHHNDNFIMVKQ